MIAGTVFEHLSSKNDEVGKSLFLRGLALGLLTWDALRRGYSRELEATGRLKLDRGSRRKSRDPKWLRDISWMPYPQMARSGCTRPLA